MGGVGELGAWMPGGAARVVTRDKHGFTYIKEEPSANPKMPEWMRSSMAGGAIGCRSVVVGEGRRVLDRCHNLCAHRCSPAMGGAVCVMVNIFFFKQKTAYEMIW